MERSVFTAPFWSESWKSGTRSPTLGPVGAAPCRSTAASANVRRQRGRSATPTSLTRPVSGLEYDLDATVLFVVEHLIPAGRVVQAERVGDDETRVDVAVFDVLQQRAQIAVHVSLA